MGPRPLPYVDPHEPRGWLYGGFNRLVSTRLAARLSRTSLWKRTVWKLDPLLLGLTRGRLCTTLMVPTALLETRGAHTGALRRNPVIYFNDGERVTIVASQAGAERHPAWFHNARANPDVRLGRWAFRAVVVEDEAARARLWELADRVFPAYATYRAEAARVGRTIPILQLLPRPGRLPPGAR